ncbi:MAG: restriction endonuclease [Nostocales cyanobacterium 94392]|nr:restriction endonuclease [Nostocales cyanobacterium 94392]
MYVQKIIFGSPGTGKSYAIVDIAKNRLEIEFQETAKILSNTVKTVFHPEYNYFDFMGKLLPLTNGGSVIYKYYPGDFLKALGIAYKNLLENVNSSNCLLVIDELNRGNAAAIFGSVFQLLDRNDDGWSTYELDISDMELVALFNVMGHKANVNNDFSVQVDGSRLEFFIKQLVDKYSSDTGKTALIKLLEQRKIKIPPNLSIIATINTSDESIYYLDSAFKRRWDWQHYPSPNYKSKFTVPPIVKEANLILPNDLTKPWYKYILGINEFIKSYHQDIRRIEDKQIGWWFIKPINGQVTLEQVKDKLMFYLWDSVFARNKQLLIKYIEDELDKNHGDIVTFSDFLLYTEDLLEQWSSSLKQKTLEQNELFDEFSDIEVSNTEDSHEF